GEGSNAVGERKHRTGHWANVSRARGLQGDAEAVWIELVRPRRFHPGDRVALYAAAGLLGHAQPPDQPAPALEHRHVERPIPQPRQSTALRNGRPIPRLARHHDGAIALDY